MSKNKCKNKECVHETVGDRLYCPTHNRERIKELGYNPDMGIFRGAVFVQKPDTKNIVIPVPKNDKYYQDNRDYSEEVEDGQSN